MLFLIKNRVEFVVEEAPLVETSHTGNELFLTFSKCERIVISGGKNLIFLISNFLIISNVVSSLESEKGWNFQRWFIISTDEV